MDKEKNITPSENNKGMDRRDVLKSLATIPVLGAFAYGVFSENKYRNVKKDQQKLDLGMSANDADENLPINTKGQTIRLGMIGHGGRGRPLAQALGFIHPRTIDEWKQGAVSNKNDKRYEDFLKQEDLNVQITAICDVFDTRAEDGQIACANLSREGTDKASNEPVKRYRNYKDLIASPDVDAVVISTPDHWHGPMTIEAAKQGKHVYCEKPLTWRPEETYEVRKAVKESGIVFQLGHQGRQTDSYNKAKEAIQKNVLGTINLIEVTTNRNSPNSAWVYDIPENASPENIDWEQFIGQAPWHDFSLERFFRWRCWWDYSNGLSGDLLTHEYDAINQIMHLGIPYSAMSSGGIYYFKDGRTVPDVLTTTYEYPERDLSLMYSATLSSLKSRGKRIMGHDGYMELSNQLFIYADRESTRYKDKIDAGIIDPDRPIFSFVPGQKNADAMTSATEKYFAARGLLYTYRGGQRLDTTHLHLREWLEAIRGNGKTSCDIDQAFQEAMTAHMSALSYKLKKQVFWDAENEKIIV